MSFTSEKGNDDGKLKPKTSEFMENPALWALKIQAAIDAGHIHPDLAEMAFKVLMAGVDKHQAANEKVFKNPDLERNLVETAFSTFSSITLSRASTLRQFADLLNQFCHNNDVEVHPKPDVVCKPIPSFDSPFVYQIGAINIRIRIGDHGITVYQAIRQSSGKIACIPISIEDLRNL